MTATAIQLGDLSKIVVCDNYSKADTSSVFDDLRSAVNDGKIAANGNIYSSGKSSLLADLVDAADTAKGGVFNKETDLIIITGSDTYVPSIITQLKDDYGFKKILSWCDITDYSALISFVSSYSLAIDGKVSDYVNKMNDQATSIASKLTGVEKRDAFYVTYSGSAYKVGNTGSLANSMIIAAGGNSVTVDSTKSATYEANLTEIMENHQNAVIFLDSSIYSDEAKLTTVKNSVGSSATLVNLNPLWNNYSIASMDGVMEMAKAMYPDIFGGDPSDDDSEGSGSNTLVYVGAAAIVIIAIAGVAFFLMRKH